MTHFFFSLDKASQGVWGREGQTGGKGKGMGEDNGKKGKTTTKKEKEEYHERVH